MSKSRRVTLWAVAMTEPLKGWVDISKEARPQPASNGNYGLGFSNSEAMLSKESAALLLGRVRSRKPVRLSITARRLSDGPLKPRG